MRKYIRALSISAVILSVSGCASGVVSDKRAPGNPGDKILQIQVRLDKAPPFGRKEIWVTVSDDEWDSCRLYAEWPECTTLTPSKSGE